MTETTTTTKTALTPNDYLDLWKHFQARADDLKAEMFERVTWILGIASALIAFAIGEPGNAKSVASAFVAVLSAIGLALCAYALIIINEYAKHIQRNWARADECLKLVSGLAEIWNAPAPQSKRGGWLRRPWNQVCLVVLAFVLIFVAGLVLALGWPDALAAWFV